MPSRSASADSSVLILMHRVGRLDLLKVVGDRLAVPTAVVDEIAGKSDGRDAIEALRADSAFVAVDVDTTGPSLPDWLGRGEAAAIRWASRYNAVVLLDDLRARRLAEDRGLVVVGCLGVAALAKRRGMIPQAKPLINALVDAGLYASDAIIRKALQIAGES